MIASGKKLDSKITTNIFEVVSEEEILLYYFGISKIKKGTIKSLLRPDEHPSCAMRRTASGHIRYKDFATGENYSVIELCSMYFFNSIRIKDTIDKIMSDMHSNVERVHNIQAVIKKNKELVCYDNHYSLDVVVRPWKDYDYSFWMSFGISREWLAFANVFPIRNYIYTYDNGYKSIKGADKYAYAYLETKENKKTFKIYQPFNKFGRKWRNNHDKSVVSLWTQAMSSNSKYVCICSSTKDALCLWANIGIPAIAVQSENTTLSNTAISVLKKRFANIYILLDNDEAGKRDAKILADKTGFTNLELPDVGAKDISDFYKQSENKEYFVEVILNLFKNNH